ncbi:MAG TPA: NUDIX hydrolase [Candidatus Dojkabacteria bacterium]|nr:NUDIX hydrolase [Candidatus Dojkabacteria bacterium]
MKIVAKSLVYDANNKILILRRSLTHPNNPHHSDLPGGEVDGNENEIEAVAREIKEEAGLDISVSSLKLVYEKTISEEVKHVLYTTKIDDSEPLVTISWEHDAYTWKSLKDLKDDPLPQNVDIYYLTVLEYLNSTKQI